MSVTAGRLAGRRAVVAGVGPGMGSAIAQRLAEDGAHVFLVARSEERLATLVEELRTRDRKADAHAADLADLDSVNQLLVDATARMGAAPDLLVNAVGSWRPGAAGSYDEDVIASMLRLNLQTVFTTTPLFAQAMEANGGVIINVGASFGVNFASRGQAVYNATKAAVASYTQSSAADLLDKGIRVNAVLPGGTTHDFTPDRDVQRLRRLGQDRMGAPEDVAAAVAFLASDDASWITGTCLTVDGGEALRHA